VLLIARVALVLSGWLFGAGRILGIDAIVSALAVVAIAYGHHKSKAYHLKKDGKDAPTGSLSDWLGITAAVLGIPALIISVSNVVAPSTPNSLSAPACAGAPIYSFPYYGFTTGPIGNYARSGPGLAFPQTDRFAGNCTLGFAGYCLGDPVEEPFTKWLDTRWLLVGRHTREPEKTASRWLSNEFDGDRFVNHAYVAPNRPDRDLHYLGDERCHGGRPAPGTVSVTASPVTAKGVTFELQVNNAERIGMALALPDDQIRSGSSVKRIYSVPTGAGGTAEVDWNAALTAKQLAPGRTTSVDIAALAVACLGPVGPADANSATVLHFTVTPGGTIAQTKGDRPSSDLVDKLRRAACDSEPFPAGNDPTTSR
jgi:hypothetical protein